MSEASATCHAEGCSHSHGTAPASEQHPHRVRKVMGVVLAVMGCAACPACLSLYSVLLGALGIGLVVGQVVHVALTIISVLFVMLLGARRFRQGQRGPLLVACGAGALLLGAHTLGDNVILEAGGTLALLTSYLWGLFSRQLQARST